MNVLDVLERMSKHSRVYIRGAFFYEEAMKQQAENAAALEAVRKLVEALRDVLPYAEACIGPSWRATPPTDSVITAAKSALAPFTQEPKP